MAAEDEIEAYDRLYKKSQVEQALRKALADRASGVTMTSLTFEGGSSTGTINGKPEDLIAILNAVLDRKEGKQPVSPTSHWDFSCVRLGT